MTPKQQRFVDEYRKDGNATRAAIRAGYSEKSADKIGTQLLGKTSIAAAVAENRKEASERCKIDADWVLERLKIEAALTYEEGGTQSGRVQAIGLIAKILGITEHPVKVEQVEKVEIVIEVVDANPPNNNPALPAAI